jgi:opacity protein-like surface antigen
MKKALLFAFLIIPCLLFAQGKSFFGISGGVTLPVSPDDFTKYWSTSFNLGVDYERQLINSDLFSLGAELNYANFSLNKTVAGLDSTLTGGSLSATQILAYAKIEDFTNQTDVVPYGRIGVGLSITTFSNIRTTSGKTVLIGSSDNGLGFALAAGILFKMQSQNRISFEISYRANNRPSESFKGILINLGYRFSM